MEDHIGSIQLNQAEKVVFSIKKWKAEYGLDIRKHVILDNYQGPTKQGVRIHKKGLKKIIKALNDCDLSSCNNDMILAEIPKDSDIDIVIQISSFSGKLKLDLRERINGKDKSYFTKKGLSIPLQEVSILKRFLEEAVWAFDNNYSDQ